MRIATLAIVVLISACASSAPKAPPSASPPPAPAAPPAATEQKSVKCTGGAIALIAITKPWGLKDCVSGEDH